MTPDPNSRPIPVHLNIPVPPAISLDKLALAVIFREVTPINAIDMVAREVEREIRRGVFDGLPLPVRQWHHDLVHVLDSVRSEVFHSMLRPRRPWWRFWR